MMKKMSKNKFKNIVRRVILLVLGIILGLNVYLANARGILGNQLPMPFGTGLGVILSGSMEPKYHVNDVIVVSEEEKYSVGDVVVYQNMNELIVHRIVEINDKEIVTKGDANSTSDQPIKQEMVKGKVKARIPYLGILVNFLKKPVGVILVLLAAILLIEFSFIKEKEADDKQIEAIKEEIRRLKESQKEDQAVNDKEETEKI